MKNPHAVALGKLGGLKGGPARKAKLSPDRRSAIAKHAVEARWKKHNDNMKRLNSEHSGK